MKQEEATFVARSTSSDSANTIIHRERQRKQAGSSTKSSKNGVWKWLSCGNDPSLVLEPHFPNMMDRVVIIGAGAIGGFVGCCLYQGGRYSQVTFLVRNEKQIEKYALVGFRAHSTTDPDFQISIPAKDIRRVFTTDPACLKEVSCVLVATKRTSNADVHRMLCRHGVQCPVVFLQNGCRIREELMEISSQRTGQKLGVNYEVIESIVMFGTDLNKDTGIVTLGQPVKDALVVLDGHQQAAKDVCDLFADSAITFYPEKNHDIINLQAAKLQVNMMNAINALSGVTVADTLREPGYRLVLAHCIDECRAVLAAHGIRLQAVGNESSNFRLSYMSSFLRAWNVVFLPAMGAKLELLNSKCCMAQDLDNCVRPTEIDYLNGVVIRLGRLAGVKTPINEKIVDLVKRAEALQLGSPKLSPLTLLTEVGLVKAMSEMRQRRDITNKLMSFDSLREESIGDSGSSSFSASEADTLSLGERVRSTLSIAMFSSEELSFIGSPPVSPIKSPRKPTIKVGKLCSPNRAALATPTSLDPSAEMVMSFDRSVRLWN